MVSLSNRPLVVDARKAEVFVVRRAEGLEQLSFRVGCIDRPAADGLEQVS